MTHDLEQLYERVEGALESSDDGALPAALSDARAADIAEVMDLLEDEERSQVLYGLPPRTAAEVVILLDEAVRGEIVEDLGHERISQIITELPPDDAADMMAELPIEQFGEVLEHLSDERSDQITELLSYGEATAGGIMNPQLATQPASATVAQAVEHLRSFSRDEDLHFIYVVDEAGKLVGTLPLRRLVLFPGDTPLNQICDRDPVTVTVDMDQEDVLTLIRRYDLPAVPVVDQAGVLRGRITHDDVMDVAEEEAAEDLYRMAGTDAAELETHSAFRAARVRMVWLTPCMFGTMLVGVVLAGFHHSILSATQMATLILFAPMIAATAGNAGIQASTIIVRGFATGDFAAQRLGYVFAREVRIAGVIGVMCAVATAAISIGFLHVLRALGSDVSGTDVIPARVGLAVGLGMLCAICLSVSLGIGLPFIFRRLGVDPAIASGPLISSMNDVVSATMYFSIALFTLR